MRPTRPRSTCMRPGATVALIADVRDAATGAAPAAAREAGLEVVDRRDRPGDVAAGWACAASSLAALSMDRSLTAARSPAMRCSCPAATRRACISSRSRAASSRGTPVARPFCPDRHAERERSAGACRGVDGLESVLEDGAQAGVAAARAAGRDAEWQPIRAVARDFQRAGRAGCAAAGRAQAPSRAFVDFQNDVTTQGSRAGRARRLRVDRAHQALHDDRHGDRPGQDVEHERARDRGRRPRATAAGRGPDHVPHAVHAGDVRRARRL